MNKLLYIDSFGIGPFHETFNSSSLKMMSEIFDNVEHYSTKSSFEAVSKLLHNVPENINHHNLFVLKPKCKIGILLKLFSSFILNIYFVLSKIKKNDIAFFNYNSLWAIPFINWYCKRSKKNVIIMWHGELEFLYNKQRLNFISDKALHWIQRNDVRIADTLYFCVAGKSILRNLHLVIPQHIITHFTSFEHTFIHQINSSSSVSQHGKKNPYPIKIGTVGGINKYKGLDNILQLAEEFHNTDKITIYALGRIRCPIEKLEEKGIKYIPNAEKTYISKEILNKYIDDMDMIFFLYPTNKYKLTASGAIFDSIDRKKFILSLHNDYFDNLFQRVPIGKQFQSISEMAIYIKAMKQFPEINYNDILMKLSPEYEAAIFKETLKKIFPYFEK